MDRLVRPRKGRVIAGVCSAVAVRFGWNITLVRILTVAAVLFAGLPLGGVYPALDRHPSRALTPFGIRSAPPMSEEATKMEE